MNEDFEKVIGYKFKNNSILQEALTHSSYKNEQPNDKKDNERLEFLGDSVLSLIVTKYLFENFKDTDEGKLSKMRASLVYNKSLVSFAKKINLGDMLKMGRGEEHLGGRNRPSILENAFEALIGAIFIDGGLESACEFVYKFIKDEKSIDGNNLYDYKSKFMEYAQKNGNVNIEYIVLNESGPSHNKTFEVLLKLNGKPVGKGKGKSKKKAEQSSAYNALVAMGYEDEK